MPREISTTASGRWTEPAAMESTSIKTELFTKVSGKTICSTVMGMKNGWMEVLIWAGIARDKKKGWVFTNGTMALTTKVNGTKTR